MKLTGNFMGKLFACVTALIFVSSMNIRADSMQQGSAKVRQIRGSAKYTTSAGGEWLPLKVGATLKAGSSIKTAAESIVDLDLGVNGPVVRVTPDTTVGL
ncbi:MAG: hypothetical protein ABJC04_02065, partial [Verrucomicrobiota bacterium]